MSYQYIYVLRNLTKILPQGKALFKDISLSFFPGAKIGILGVNGTGKSTLLKVMAGLDQDFTGEAFAADGVSIGYLPQEPKLDPNLTVDEHVQQGLGEIKALRDAFDALSARFAEPMSDSEMDALLKEQATLQEKIDAADGWSLERRVEIAKGALRLPPGDAKPDTLSGGEVRRVALCKLLLSEPDLLLLDEPTNHLDAESVAWLQRFLKDYKGTVVLVTHDRYFLDEVVGWILELDRGEGYPFEGNYSDWLVAKQKRLLQESREQVQRGKAIARELEWVRSAPKGRHSQSKARLKAYDDLVSEQGAEKRAECVMRIPEAPRLGGDVLSVTHLTKAHGGRTLFEDLSFVVPKGALVGVIGANGMGKTSLFRLIVGQDQPDQGTVALGETVRLGYVDQSRAGLNDNKTVWEDIADGEDEVSLGKQTMASRAYVAQFGFKGSDQQKKVGVLSGGERNRLHLAKLLKRAANVLLLDEPTNDLDVDTLRALEEALLNFSGCAMIISHDRWFLDRLATHILAFEGDGRVVFFEGNYAHYEQDKVRRLGEDAALTFKYKPLTR